MESRYRHLTSEERGVILAENRRGASLRKIGGLLGRAPSTIGRELARGRLGDAPYDPQVARSVHDARRLLCRPRAKLAEGAALHDFLLENRCLESERIAVALPKSGADVQCVGRNTP